MQKLLTTALAAVVLLGACRQEVKEEPTVNAPEPEAPAPRLPAVERPLDRAGVLQAVGAAASAAGLGRNDAAAQRRLDGKTFEVRIRFGCANSGAAGSDPGPFGVRFEEDSRTLRVRAAPDLTIDDPAVAQIAGEGVEAVEGFWMRRPWLLADGCPAGAANPAQAFSQRVGLAQFYGAADSRIGQRKDRAYEATATLADDERPSLQGYNLVLSGRLRKLASGRVVSCSLAGRDAPPQCVVSAEFDHVWIEHPQTHAVLAEWNS